MYMSERVRERERERERERDVQIYIHFCALARSLSTLARILTLVKAPRNVVNRFIPAALTHFLALLLVDSVITTVCPF